MSLRTRRSRITVPNAGNAQLMRTRSMRPFRREDGGGVTPLSPFGDVGVFALTVGQQGTRYGLTIDTGAISPSTAGPWQITLLRSRTDSSFTLRLDSYGGTYTGDLRVLMGSLEAVLAYDGGEEWVGVSTPILQYLQANVGNTLMVRLEGV